MRPIRWILLAEAVVALASCRADIPDGVFECVHDNDCPTGFVCRSEGEDSTVKYCFGYGASEEAGITMSGADGGEGGAAGQSDGGGALGLGATGSDGGAGAIGGGSSGATGGAGPRDDGGSRADASSEGGAAGPEADAGDDGGGAIPVLPVPPTSTGLSTLGGRRRGGSLAVYDDGFEMGPRLCTGNGRYCVTGGFTP